MPRRVTYIQHEFHFKPKRRTVSLAGFVLDVPYLVMFNVLPPLKVLNQVLSTGGSEGGMSPGATWEPFQVTPEEYEEMVQELSGDISHLKQEARYAEGPYIRDEAFSQAKDRFAWLKAVSEKYREVYLRQVNGAAEGDA